jgi:hypothetical protein
LTTESASAPTTPLERATAFARSNAAAPVALAVMMLASVLARVWLARAVKTPWILVDEFLYSEQAKSFATSGHYAIRGAAGTIVSYLYPALIAPAWLAGSMPSTYGLAKAINAVLMTLAAIPVYLWGIRLAPRRYALVAVGLTLLLPSFFYTGELMTENAFFPAFVTGAFAIALALERPTLLRQALMLVGLLVTVAVRFQGLVLFAVLPTALLLKVLFDILGREGETRRRIVQSAVLPFWPTGAALAVAGGAYAAYKHHQGVSLSSGLGAYEVVTGGHYSFREGARWTLYHFAELPLAFGYVPICAFLVLLGIGLLRPKTVSAAERSFLAVTAAAAIWLVAEVGVFASRYSFRIEERNMFALAPLFLLALALWLARGAPRPPLVTLVAVALPAALLVTVPLVRLLNPSIFSDTFGLVPLLRLSQRLSGGIPLVKKLLIAGGVVGGLLFAFTPRRFAAPVIVGSIAVFLVLTSYSVHGAIRDYARNLAGGTGVSDNPTWVDDRVGGRDVGVLYGYSSDTFQEAVALWEAEFWNRRLSRVYTVGPTEPVGLAETAVTVNAANGRLTATGADPSVQQELAGTRDFVTDSGTDLVGRSLATHGPFALHALTPPPRIANLVSGVYADGWMGADASYRRYVAPSRGDLTVTLSRKSWHGPDVPGHVRVQLVALRGPRSGQAVGTRTWTLHSGKGHAFTLSTPSAPFTVNVHVEPTFSPSGFGRPDTRQLGAQVSFAYRARRHATRR